MAMLLPRLGRLKAGTTLGGVYGWALFAFWGAVLCDPLATLLVDSDLESLRFAVACLQLCPTMALLGVRKPHHRAWNVVVVSLWLVAVLPAVLSTNVLFARFRVPLSEKIALPWLALFPTKVDAFRSM